MHNNREAGCQGNIQSEGCKVCVRFGRSLHGGLRVLGFPAPDGITGRIIAHIPTSLDSTVAEISSRDVCWFLLRLRNPPLRIQSSPGQTVTGYADSAILAAGRQKLNSLLCCIDSSVVLIFFHFNCLCLVIKHSGSHRYECKSHVKHSFIKRSISSCSCAREHLQAGFVPLALSNSLLTSCCPVASVSMSVSRWKETSPPSSMSEVMLVYAGKILKLFSTSSTVTCNMAQTRLRAQWRIISIPIWRLLIWRRSGRVRGLPHHRAAGRDIFFLSIV